MGQQHGDGLWFGLGRKDFALLVAAEDVMGWKNNSGFFVSFAANMTLAVSQWGRKQEAKQGCAPVTLAVSQTHGGTATW